jgi:hypothetical protein
MDDRKIFTLALYVPSLPKVEEPGTPADRFLRTDRHLDVEWYIKNEFGTEAGNMAISGRSRVPCSYCSTDKNGQYVGLLILRKLSGTVFAQPRKMSAWSKHSQDSILKRHKIANCLALGIRS